MLQKTRGIVFRVVKYGENGIIVKIYTELFGIQSYLVKGARGRRSKLKPAYFQPLALLEMVVEHNEKEGLKWIKELKTTIPFSSIYLNPVKNAIVLFLNEILYKSIREEEGNTSLFRFIYDSLCILDAQMENYHDFHLSFIVQLSRFLGFSPHGNYSAATPYFNLREGIFESNLPVHDAYLEPQLSKRLSDFLHHSLSDLSNINISASTRKLLLQKLIQYFELHLTTFKNIKSHEILAEAAS